MKTQTGGPAVIIKKRHQSAAKPHWADREIQKAAVEIDEGRYVPEPHNAEEKAADGLGLALGLGTGGAATGEKPLLEDFHQTRDLNELGRHPRVEEALARMRQEIDDHPESQEAVEASWRMRETLERSSYDQRWQGQRRWEGKENVEMRQGRVLSPQMFYAELCNVIGYDRVLLGRFAFKTDPEAKSGRVGLYIPNPEWCGHTQMVEFAHVKADELKKAAEQEIVKAKRLRLAKQNAEADRSFHMAGDMIQAASEMLMQRQMTIETEENKEFLRVGILQWPLGTEWMQMNFNEYGVPTTAKFTGWRTALLTMVRQHVLTEDEAEEAFPVGQGPAAEWYKEQLWLRRKLGYAM